MILCDTNILVAYYRANAEIREQLIRHRELRLCVSVVTLAELYFGARDKGDLARIRRHLREFEILPIDLSVSGIFVQLMETFSLSHRLSIPDALIAATALVHQAELFTLNVRDFRFIPDVQLFEP